MPLIMYADAITPVAFIISRANECGDNFNPYKHNGGVKNSSGTQGDGVFKCAERVKRRQSDSHDLDFFSSRYIARLRVLHYINPTYSQECYLRIHSLERLVYLWQTCTCAIIRFPQKIFHSVDFRNRWVRPIKIDFFSSEKRFLRELAFNELLTCISISEIVCFLTYEFFTIYLFNKIIK